MPNNRAELLEVIRQAEGLGLPAPADVLLELARQDAEEKIQAIDLTIKPEDLPIFTLTQPGAVPASRRPGLILTSTGWALPPKHPADRPMRIFGGGGGAGGVTDHALLTNLDYVTAGHTGFQEEYVILNDLGALPDAIGWLHNDGAGNLAWSIPAGGGNVFGVAPSVAGNFAAFNNLTGTLIQDTGYSAASFDPAGAAAGITLAGLGGQPVNIILTTLSGLANAAGMLTNNGAGVLAWTAIPATHNPVTLDINADTILSLSTQALGLDTQTAAYVWAGPTAGIAAVPTFRALVATDIPALSYQAPGNYITALTSDVTASGPGSVAATIAAGAVTLAKMADLPQYTLIGQIAAPMGVPQALSVAQVNTLLGNGLSTGARVYNSTNTLLTNLSSKRMTFDSEVYDDANYHDTGSNTSRLTIPADGKYIFGCSASIEDNANGIRVGWILKNGLDVIAKHEASPPATSDDCAFTLSGSDDFVAGDFIELWLYQNSGTNLNALYDAEFSVYFWIQQTGGGPIGPPGSGNVNGPGSAVNNNFAAFDGTTGKIIKDSGYSGASFEPIDATIVRTGQTNWIDLTDGGSTTLHSHAGGVGGGAFQRNLAASLTLADGESLVIAGYINTATFSVILNGDSRLEIL
jgi:hypothetical protein